MFDDSISKSSKLVLLRKNKPGILALNSVEPNEFFFLIFTFNFFFIVFNQKVSVWIFGGIKYISYCLFRICFTLLICYRGNKSARHYYFSVYYIFKWINLWLIIFRDFRYNSVFLRRHYYLSIYYIFKGINLWLIIFRDFRYNSDFMMSKFNIGSY